MRCPTCGAVAGAVKRSLEEAHAERETALRLLAFLNAKAGRNYQSAVNLGFIRARLKAGATEAQCRAVIARKVREWKDDDKMAPYLRPATLFNATKFASYLGELPSTAFAKTGAGDADQ